MGRIFPLFGSQLGTAGHDLSRPLGASYAGFWMERSFVVTDIAVALDGSDPVSIEAITVLPAPSGPISGCSPS